MFQKPKPKITKQENILDKHDFSKNAYMCYRCQKTEGEIESGKLDCISETRAIGNEAIRRIVRD